MKQLYLFNNCKPDWSMLTTWVNVPQLSKNKGQTLKTGVCHHVANLLIDIMAQKRILQNNDNYRLVPVNPGAVSHFCMEFSPKGWHCIEHFAVLVQ